jgi:hypothetical protein
MLCSELVGEAVESGVAQISSNHFLIDWISAAGTEVLLNPVVALLSVALVLQLGCRPAHGPAEVPAAATRRPGSPQ